MTRSSIAIAVLITLTSAGIAADPPNIDRTIGKEPAYQTKPSYYLLVFGPQAKSRVWLVLDGEHLYVDRNANGDLTDEGERFSVKTDSVRLSEIIEIDGKTKHKDLFISVKSRKGQTRIDQVSVEIKGRYEQYTFFDEPGKRPQDAPFRHFHGPLQLELSDQDDQVFVKGDKPEDLQVQISTVYPGGEWVYVLHSNDVSFSIPDTIHPVAEISFPTKDPSKPTSIKVPLTQRC